MQHSESIKEIAAALLKAQQSFETATKDADNPFFKSKYADLPEVWRVAKGPLGANGLAIIQSPESDGNGGIEIETMLVHAPSGEWIKSRIRMKPEGRSAGDRLLHHIRKKVCALRLDRYRGGRGRRRERSEPCRSPRSEEGSDEAAGDSEGR